MFGSLALLTAAAALGTTSPPPGQLAPIHGAYAPKIDPANFARKVDNRFFPLKPGATWHYVGVRGKVRQTDDVLVTRRKKMIMGVRTVAVRDTVSQRGHAIERTLDYYAQDKQGNVWYMGEDAFEKQHGHFALASDSWIGG